MESKNLIGKFIALGAIVAAVAIGAVTLHHIDRSPRTHDAFLFADTAAMAPDVSGRIVALKVLNNQRVKKGTPLVEIDPEPFQLRVRQAQAQIQALKAQIRLTSRQVASQTFGAEAAANQVGRARAQSALAHDTRARLEPLLGKGYVTDQQIDEARTNERSAQIAVTAAEAQASQAQKAIGDTDTLQAQLAGAEAALALAERDLRNAVLLAPFDGLVVGLEIAEGEYAVAGKPLFSLIKTGQWYAVANFRETELDEIRAGDPATVWLMVDGQHPLKGRVESLGWGVRPDDVGGPGLPGVGKTLHWVIVAQRFPVRILLDDPPAEQMRIGATVSVMVRHDQRS